MTSFFHGWTLRRVWTFTVWACRWGSLWVRVTFGFRWSWRIARTWLFTVRRFGATAGRLRCSFTKPCCSWSSPHLRASWSARTLGPVSPCAFSATLQRVWTARPFSCSWRARCGTRPLCCFTGPRAAGFLSVVTWWSRPSCSAPRIAPCPTPPRARSSCTPFSSCTPHRFSSPPPTFWTIASSSLHTTTAP